MNARRFVAALCTLSLLGACGSPDDAPSSKSGAPPVSSPGGNLDSPVSSTPGDPGDGAPLGGVEIVEPRPGMADVRARMFTRAIPVDDKTIRVVFFSGVEPCAVLDRVEVEESEESVTITLHEGRDPDGGDQPCIELAVKKAVIVEIESPLADRKILDGAV